jgi:nickel/cobalt transporter (NiCoT) family protein
MVKLRPRLSARWRLAVFVSCVALLHVAGWALFLWYSHRYVTVAGLGVTAYLFGLRHAFDADHIAAIDNVNRRLVERGETPMGTGFFFSAGHSTVVLVLTVSLAIATTAAAAVAPAIRTYGAVVGGGVSGSFLCLLGAVNLTVLLGMVRSRRAPEVQPAGFGWTRTRFVRRLLGLMSASWHMYLVGFLFALGFDTATEIGLLALSAGAATHAVPLAAVVSLPVLFAAGMTLMDTLDGVFMVGAYRWATSHPGRRASYNIVVTGLSVAVALTVGCVELAESIPISTWQPPAQIQTLGFALVAATGVAWVTAVTLRSRRGESNPGPHHYE